jgi:hypothetical protein
MYKIIIDLKTEKSANLLKEELEGIYPLLDGRINIFKQPKIKSLSEVIEDIKNRRV